MSGYVVLPNSFETVAFVKLSMENLPMFLRALRLLRLQSLATASDIKI